MARRDHGSSLDCKVYVGELGSNGSREELETAFAYFGPLKEVWVARNPPGFAFIMFEDPRDARDAVHALDGKVICGRRVKVELSNGKSRRDKPRSPSPSYSPYPPRGREYRDSRDHRDPYDRRLPVAPPPSSRAYSDRRFDGYAPRRRYSRSRSRSPSPPMPMRGLPRTPSRSPSYPRHSNHHHYP